MRAIAITQPRSRTSAWDKAKAIAHALSTEKWIAIFACAIAIGASLYFFSVDLILAYGDAESHLNIAKRVVSSLTPGLAQLGGIWLPLPHLLLVPFVYFDNLWRTGLAGAIVSGIAFIISSVYIFKLTHYITRHKIPSAFAALIFMTNPNILYLQATPMTELVLIAFFVLSSYYFIVFLDDKKKLVNLIYAAFFGFCASLSRYDGWALVLMEAAIIGLYYFPYRLRGIAGKIKLIKEHSWGKLEGRLILFSTLAFFGVVLWLTWDFLILSDPLYFTHSEFSAKSQQQSWLARGELPAYKNPIASIAYYSVTAAQNMGYVMTGVSLLGLLIFALDKRAKHRLFTLMLLAVPFIFNITTLYLGQSVIFIPSLTPESFTWNLFNVRYGVMMIPFFAFGAGYAFNALARTKLRVFFATSMLSLLVMQLFYFSANPSQVLALEDGRVGLSSQIRNISDAQIWFYRNYDSGKLLLDDFSRVLSITKSPVKMQDVIYIGNKPYWEESLKTPEKHAQWIFMQKDDAIWKNLWENQAAQEHLFTYYNKVYTSDEILIFKRIENASAQI
jgi:hypothetical protein